MTEIKRGPKSPVYILHGQEGYFIDRLTEAFEETVPDDMRGFNLYQIYAPEVEMSSIISAARSFPMMGERQVVIVKEAQAVKADEINKLHSYVSSPSPTTVFVLCFRGAEAKGKDLLAAARKGGYPVFESKKVYDNTLPAAIREIVKEQGLNIEQKSVSMLADYIGTDVARIYGEVKKLAMVLGEGSMITPEVIERHIGVSKDYNNFELLEALSVRNAGKALAIVAYFRANPKGNPTVITASALYDYFSGLLAYHWSRQLSRSDMMRLLGVKHPNAMLRYDNGVKTFTPRAVIQIISAIRDFDRKTKGVGSRMNEYDLLQQLIIRILYS